MLRLVRIKSPSNTIATTTIINCPAMKCYSVIRTVCLVLSVQMVVLSGHSSDAKSIGPSSFLSLMPTTSFNSTTTTTSTATNTSSAARQFNTTASSSRFVDERSRSSGANDPPFPAGQEHRSPTSRQSRISGESRFIQYVPKYSIDHLLEHFYENKISDDIDLDPCKTGT